MERSKVDDQLIKALLIEFFPDRANTYLPHLAPNKRIIQSLLQCDNVTHFCRSGDHGLEAFFVFL